ncbi:MAG: hypothetical protein ABS77_00335 [Phenylobacterium sp. SCN 69-14]|nr:MAG: hypothetical protein ABS77_00335 [Phenylobacterium sp. SCN 69-14]
MNKSLLFGSVALLTFAAASSAGAVGFINGGFEDGNANGWTETGGYRGSITNAGLKTATFAAGGGRSSVISSSYVDPNLGSKLGSTVANGNYAYRVENTYNGGYASVLSQQVNGYTDSQIYFAWKAVLEGAHGTNDAATLIITLKDLTSGSTLISREYNAASSGGGVDSRFTYDNASGAFYTANWQIEQLNIDASLSGHDFLLSVLAADCQPTGHYGYAYIDGFGNAPPPVSGVPEPATWAMMILGFGAAGAAMRNNRRRQAALAVA